MTYKPSWDLSTVPDDLIIAEAGRRRAAMRTKRAGGRPVSNMTPAGIKRRERMQKQAQESKNNLIRDLKTLIGSGKQ